MSDNVPTDAEDLDNYEGFDLYKKVLIKNAKGSSGLNEADVSAH